MNALARHIRAAMDPGQRERALERTAQEAAEQMVSHEMAFGRAADLLRQIQAICDAPIDERAGKGPTRHEQFVRIEALVRDLPYTLRRDGFDWGAVREQAEEWVSTRLAADRRAVSGTGQREREEYVAHRIAAAILLGTVTADRPEVLQYALDQCDRTQPPDVAAATKQLVADTRRYNEGTAAELEAENDKSPGGGIGPRTGA